MWLESDKFLLAVILFMIFFILIGNLIHILYITNRWRVVSLYSYSVAVSPKIRNRNVCILLLFADILHLFHERIRTFSALPFNHSIVIVWTNLIIPGIDWTITQITFNSQRFIIKWCVELRHRLARINLFETPIKLLNLFNILRNVFQIFPILDLNIDLSILHWITTLLNMPNSPLKISESVLVTLMLCLQWWNIFWKVLLWHHSFWWLDDFRQLGSLIRCCDLIGLNLLHRLLYCFLQTVFILLVIWIFGTGCILVSLLIGVLLFPIILKIELICYLNVTVMGWWHFVNLKIVYVVSWAVVHVINNSFLELFETWDLFLLVQEG